MEEKQNEPEMKTQKRWFGKGIYGSKDVPIRILDKMIIGTFVLIIIMVFVFALNGGYTVTFDTYGGTEVSNQKVRYGEHIEEPDAPTRPGSEFVEWTTSEDESMAKTWNFKSDKVEEDMTLYAVWKEAE